MQNSSSNSVTSMAAFMGADLNKIKDIISDYLKDNEVCDVANYNTETQ